MPELPLTASVDRRAKDAPTVIRFTAETWMRPEIPAAVRMNEADRDDKPGHGRHWHSADLAIPATGGYDAPAEAFTYPVLLRITGPAAARALIAALTDIATRLDTPWQQCEDCGRTYPAPCLGCVGDAEEWAETAA